MRYLRSREFHKKAKTFIWFLKCNNLELIFSFFIKKINFYHYYTWKYTFNFILTNQRILTNDKLMVLPLQLIVMYLKAMHWFFLYATIHSPYMADTRGEETWRCRLFPTL